MTLAQRLMLAIGVLTVALTAALGLGVREAWRSAEEERFNQQFEGAVAGLEQLLGRELESLPSSVEPQCRFSPVVDSAVLSLSTGRLDAAERNRLAVHGPDLARSLQVDELYLFTDDGLVLTAHKRGLAGQKQPRLAELLRGNDPPARVRPGEELAVEAYCAKRSGGRAVGLYAARRLGPLLEAIGSSLSVKLSVGGGPPPTNAMQRQLTLERYGLTLTVQKSRVPLLAALQRLDLAVLAIGGSTLAVALLLTWLLSRGLARPIVKLAAQARQLTAGAPEPVQARGGGRELKELADAFNQALADLAALRKRLAATERIAARREIARQVAHEIKNPLAPIRAAVETLRRLRARQDVAFDEYFDEATTTVLDEVRRINTIVSEFTRFARLPPPNPQPIDVVETVRKVVGLHAASAGELKLELETGSCPQINADADQVVQVVTNLVQNALDAARDGGGTQVTVRVLPAGDSVVLQVADDGPGVPPEIREKLFEPYATTKPHGTGLGLAIVQRIVLEHGGEIEYRDAPGHGAVFTISLPVSGPTLLAQPPTLTPVRSVVNEEPSASEH